MGGLAQETGPPDRQSMWIALALAVVIAAVTVIPAIGFWAAVVGVLLAAIATYIFTRLTARAIGGRTGDTLGGCQQIALAAFLVGVSAF
jgi:adenosylcobinamide-GDP ribazoletransferase